jgi:hypothetical protein
VLTITGIAIHGLGPIIITIAIAIWSHICQHRCHYCHRAIFTIASSPSPCWNHHRGHHTIIASTDPNTIIITIATIIIINIMTITMATRITTTTQWSNALEHLETTVMLFTKGGTPTYFNMLHLAMFLCGSNLQTQT